MLSDLNRSKDNNIFLVVREQQRTWLGHRVGMDALVQGRRELAVAIAVGYRELAAHLDDGDHSIGIELYRSP